MASDCNLNIATGIETIHMIMDQATGNTYDFSNLLKVFNKISIQNIFHDQHRMNQSDQNVKLGDFRQSTQVFASV